VFTTETTEGTEQTQTENKQRDQFNLSLLRLRASLWSLW